MPRIVQIYDSNRGFILNTQKKHFIIRHGKARYDDFGYVTAIEGRILLPYWYVIEISILSIFIGLVIALFAKAKT